MSEQPANPAKRFLITVTRVIAHQAIGPPEDGVIGDNVELHFEIDLVVYPRRCVQKMATERSEDSKQTAIYSIASE